MTSKFSSNFPHSHSHMRIGYVQPEFYERGFAAAVGAGAAGVYAYLCTVVPRLHTEFRPSRVMVAKKCGISERTVDAYLKKLEEAGAIEKIASKRSDDLKHINEVNYYILLDLSLEALASQSAPLAYDNNELEDWNEAMMRVAESASQTAKPNACLAESAHNLVLPSNDLSLTQGCNPVEESDDDVTTTSAYKRNLETLSTDRGGPNNLSTVGELHYGLREQDITAAWNRIIASKADVFGGPTRIEARWSALIKHQFQHISSFYQHTTLDHWEQRFEHITRSMFLMGHRTSREGAAPFELRFSWLVKESNFEKVLNGEYHGPDRVWYEGEAPWEKG